MKITIASRIFSPEPAAATFRLASLADALSEAGHDVEVLTVTDRDGGAATTHREVRVRRAPVIRDASGYVRGYIQYLSFDVPLFFRLLVCKRPDVIVAEPPPTTGAVVRLVSALRRIPYVYYAADVWSDATESAGTAGIVTSVLRRIERFALRGARAVIAVSNGVADRVREISGRDNASVVTNGVDTTVFSPEGNRVADAPVAVYAGTTSEWQGADVFIRALPTVLASIPDARLHFIGQGSAWAHLRTVAEKIAPGHVTFTSTLPPRDTATHLRSARAAMVSLVPGRGYDFAVPTKIFAAAASGTPIVFAGTGPSADLIESNQLGVATTMDADAVARVLTTMLSQPPSDEERVRMSTWASANVSQASSSRKAAAVIEGCV